MAKSILEENISQRVAELKAEIEPLQVELKQWEEQQKQADQFEKAIVEANHFGWQFLDQRAGKLRERIEKGEVVADYMQLGKYRWACEFKERFSLKFGEAATTFRDLVSNEIKAEVEQIKNSLSNKQHEIEKLTRKLLRFQLKKQGQELLPCEYSNNGMLGCLGDYWCKNCSQNYSPPPAS